MGSAAYGLWNKLRTSADIDGADGSGSGGDTQRAATHMKGHSFLVGDELGNAAKLWKSQVKTALQGCAHISNHLDYSKDTHRAEDRKIGAQVLGDDGNPLPPSRISRLLD